MLQEAIKVLLSVPSEAWIGLIGVIIGAMLSVFGVWLSSQSALKNLKTQLEHQKLEKYQSTKKERLEELYVLTTNWLNVSICHHLKLSLVMAGKIDYNTYLDQFVADSKENPIDFSRLQMIIDIYGVELQRQFQQILTCRDEQNEITANHKLAYRAGNTDGSIFLEPYKNSQLKLIDLVESFKKEIATHAVRVIR